MSVKPEDKVLTYEQAKELKFFMRNCTGVRTEFYALFDEMLAFKKKFDRLQITCDLIDKHFGKEIKEWEKSYEEASGT